MTDLTPTPGAMTRIKRSRTLQLTTLMASASISLTACGAPPGVQQSEARPTPALAYTSLSECKAADDISDADCDANYQQAQAAAEKTSPRYATREQCEGEWGPSQCQTTQRDGGSFFTPLLAGFVIGQVLGGGGGRAFGGGPLYRDRDNRYSNGYGGGGVYTDYRTGRQVTDARAHTPEARQAPPRAQTRTTVVSRGGFGGGGRSFSG